MSILTENKELMDRANVCYRYHIGMMCGAKLALVVENALIEAIGMKFDTNSRARLIMNIATVVPGFITAIVNVDAAALGNVPDIDQVAKLWEGMNVTTAMATLCVALYQQHGDVEFTQEMVNDEVIRGTLEATDGTTIASSQSDTVQ